MTERDPIERRLMLARTATWAPEAAKARVRAHLASGGALAAASALRSGGVTKLTTALLVGASFIAGYWLGFRRSAEPREPAAAVGDRASPSERAPLAASGARETAEARQSPSPADIGATEGAAIGAGGEPAPLTSTQAMSPSRPTPPAPPRPRATAGHPARATPGRVQLSRAPAASNDPVAEELTLLSRAERAIRAGEPMLALSFLDELDARFPSSMLLEERLAARLLAECALSNPGSRRRAELFLSDRAASVYTDRVRRSCGLEPPAAIDPSPASPAADGSPRSGH